MKTRLATVCTICVLLLCMAAPAMAAGTAEARGLVTDPEGVPLKGVKITYRNTASEVAVYDTKTSKKGRYFLTGLLHYPTGQWQVTAELEGYVVTKINVLSRTQTAVLGKFEQKIKPGQNIPNIEISGLGKAQVDIVMTPEEVVQALIQAQMVPVNEEGEVVEEAPREDPFDTALRMASGGDLEGAVEFFEEAIADVKEPDAGRLEAYARVLYQLGRYDQAEQRAGEAAQADPAKSNPHMVLYTIHVAKKDYDAARGDLDKAAELDPNNFRLLQQQAWLALETGRTDDAIEAYQTITKKSPDNVEAWLSLGSLYAGTGQNDLSEQAYEKVVALDPSNAYQTFYNIGVLIEKKQNASDGDIQRAIEAYRKAVEIKPDYSKAHKRLGYILLRIGDLKGCRSSLEQYVELEPSAPDAAQIKGMIQGLPK